VVDLHDHRHDDVAEREHGWVALSDEDPDDGETVNAQRGARRRAEHLSYRDEGGES
jgi:hypothetical protein